MSYTWWTISGAYLFCLQLEDDLLGKGWLDCYATKILDAKYEWKDIEDVVKEMTHLEESQKNDLLEVLKKHASIFDSTLGLYPHKKFHINIKPDAKPVYSRPYSIPQIHLLMFKKELKHLVKIGVLIPQNESKWASPTFIIPKKDGRVRWVSDLRQINKVIRRKQYPLPIITDVLQKRIG